MTDQIYPEWASDKQKEGMKAFLKIAESYGNFDVKFSPYEFDSDDYHARFVADISWGFGSMFGQGQREHRFYVGWDMQQVWSGTTGERIHQWQFDFLEDAYHEMNLEIFYLDLFFKVDGMLLTENEQSVGAYHEEDHY
ncbi:hypothetical protein [Neptuniibacter sp. QD37_11]|uniref:hypothetical protein n=1 Tax=Neptuniibacter sp. QD37_11 TaxID=3398209 RepID=UPI0039F5D4C1